MAAWQRFILDAVQTAIFTPEHSAFSTGKVVASMLTRFSDRFGGDMKTLPVPSDLVPPDVPRVKLQNDDESWQLSMGPTRVDCIWTNKSLTHSPPLHERVAACAEVLEHYIQANRVRVGRVALIVRRLSRSDKPAQELISRFCSETRQREPFNRSETFEIHNHKIYTPPGLSYAVNSWVRCRTAKIASDGTPAITVEEDYNTLSQELESRQFAPAEIRLFFEKAAVEADDILRKYFPD